MLTDEAKALVSRLIEDFDLREKKVRTAWQHIDRLNEVFGLPYRPDWAQPLHDEWRETMKNLEELRRLLNG